MPVDVAVVACSDTSGGAERYLTRLYGGPGLGPGATATLYGRLPGWDRTGLPQVAVPLGPKWSRRAWRSNLCCLGSDRQRVRETFAARTPSVFHLQFKREQVLLTPMLSRLAPVVWTEHGRFATGALGHGLAAAYRRAAAHVQEIVCVSELVAESLEPVVGSVTRLRVVSNSVDTSQFRPADPRRRRWAREALGVPPDGPLVVWLGRLDAGKLPVLAARALLACGAQALLCGAGPMAGQVQQVLSTSPRTRLVPRTDRPEDLLAAADVVLFTSDGRGEGLPTVLLEAAAAALPVVLNTGSGFGSVAEGFLGTTTGDTVADLVGGLHRALGEDPAVGAASRRAWAVERDVVGWRARHAELLVGAARAAVPTARVPG